jgi:hypothetical protein
VHAEMFVYVVYEQGSRAREIHHAAASARAAFAPGARGGKGGAAKGRFERGARAGGGAEHRAGGEECLTSARGVFVCEQG